MAIFIKVQIEIKSVNLSDKSKKIVRKKLKKVCQTRWLSFHAATSAIFDDYLAVLHTLRQLKDADAVAYGLLSKVHWDHLHPKRCPSHPLFTKQDLSEGNNKFFSHQALH